MLICQKESCECSHHRLLHCLKEGLNDEAMSILESLDNVNELTDSSGSTLLHYAVNRGTVKIMEYLIDKGCNINAKDYYGYGDSPLLLAVQANNVTTVEILLKNNADIFATDPSGKSIFEVACFNYSHDNDVILEMLIEKVSIDFSNGLLSDWLLNANNRLKLSIVAFGKAEITKFVLDNGYPIDFRESAWDYTALHWAVHSARVQNAKILIDYGANVDSVGQMERSVIFDYLGRCEDADENCVVLKSLLRRTKELSIIIYDGHTTLMEMLLTCGKKKTVRTILESGIDIESCLRTNDETLVSCLVQNETGDDDVLELLFEFDVKFHVNERDANGWTILMYVAENARCNAVEILLKNGADVNIIPMTNDQATPTFSFMCYPTNSDMDRKSAIIHGLFMQYGCRYFKNVFDYDFVFDKLRVVDHFSLDTYVIIAHLALLEAIGQTYLTDLSRNRMESIPLLKNYFDLCSQQLEHIKSYKVHGSLTLFKLLADEQQKFVAYARNSELILAFNRSIKIVSHLEQHYLNVLQRKVSNGLEVARLQDKAAAVIETLTGLCIDAYHTIVRKIMNYLSRRDLINLSKVKE